MIYQLGACETVEKPESDDFAPCKWLILLHAYFDKKQYLDFFDSLYAILQFLRDGKQARSAEKTGSVVVYCHLRQ